MKKLIITLAIIMSLSTPALAQDIATPAPVEQQTPAPAPKVTKEQLELRMQLLQERFNAISQIAQFVNERIQLMRGEYQTLEAELKKLTPVPAKVEEKGKKK